MAKLEILTIPDKVLKQESEPVETVDDELRAFMDDMLETMYAAPGIGLAGPQVGMLKRIATIDVAKRSADEEGAGEQEETTPDPIFLINPRVVWSSEEPSYYEEGCLSIPDYYAEVVRPASVVVEYLDREGAERELTAEGLLATCVQHEIDHLDGILFIDHLSKLKRDRVIKRFQKMKKAKVG
ncbi:MAG: peptide deformylase [Pseudomonadota bacterium]